MTTIHYTQSDAKCVFPEETAHVGVYRQQLCEEKRSILDRNVGAFKRIYGTSDDISVTSPKINCIKSEKLGKLIFFSQDSQIISTHFYKIVNGNEYLF